MKSHVASSLLLAALSLTSSAWTAKKGIHSHPGGAASSLHANASPPELAADAPSVDSAPSNTPVPSPASSAAAAPDERVWASCTEHIPSGAAKPVMKDQFPARGISGYASSLEITVEHGKGETVLPQGLQVQTGSEAARTLAVAGFLLPDADGGAGPSVVVTSSGAGATTKISIPFLVLPKDLGRSTLTLPPVPIAVARASGELVTICTSPHRMVVEDPTSSTPDAKPKPNPEPRLQREEWTLAKQLAIGGLLGAVVAALLALLLLRWRRRPRPVPPPPPPRPPWEVALEELYAVRHAGLVTEVRFAEHYDRVSDAVRKYLGGRYGFDGLETTTREMTLILKRVEPPVAELSTILQMLEECDLVKFARLTPSNEDCVRVLDQGEHIVRVTIPPNTSRPMPAPVAVAESRGGA